MIYTFYIPIYELGFPNVDHGSKLGSTHYSNIQDLFAFEPEAISYMIVTGSIECKIF